MEEFRRVLCSSPWWWLCLMYCRRYPSWVYSFLLWILKITFTLLEVCAWVIIAYYVNGFEGKQVNWTEFVVLFEIFLEPVFLFHKIYAKRTPCRLYRKYLNAKLLLRSSALLQQHVGIWLLLTRSGHWQISCFHFGWLFFVESHWVASSCQEVYYTEFLIYLIFSHYYTIHQECFFLLFIHFYKG